MNPASSIFRHLQGSLLLLRSGCSRHYSTHQLPRSLLSRTQRPVHPRTILCRGIASRSVSSMASEPRFAEGMNTESLRPMLDALHGQGWSLDEDKIGVKKTFYFKSYFKAVSFVNVVASQSATKKHHATMTIRIGSVDVHWTTHHPRGLTDKDISMAEYCEQAAELLGAVEEGEGKKCGPGS